MELKNYDAVFAAAFNRPPQKRDKEPLRPGPRPRRGGTEGGAGSGMSSDATRGTGLGRDFNTGSTGWKGGGIRPPVFSQKGFLPPPPFPSMDSSCNRTAADHFEFPIPIPEDPRICANGSGSPLPTASDSSSMDGALGIRSVAVGSLLDSYWAMIYDAAAMDNAPSRDDESWVRVRVRVPTQIPKSCASVQLSTMLSRLAETVY